MISCQLIWNFSNFEEVFAGFMEVVVKELETKSFNCVILDMKPFEFHFPYLGNMGTGWDKMISKVFPF